MTPDMKMIMKIGVGVPIHFKVTKYFATGFGIIKTVGYNKKGEKTGYTVLTQMGK